MISIALLFLASLADGRPAPVIRFEARSLAVAGGAEIPGETGRLQVPENRAASDAGSGAVIELAVARLRCTGEKPGPPIVFLAGGPGQSATATLGDAEHMALWTELRQLGDIVLMDQRGVGRSRPKLSCEATGDPAALLLSRASAAKWFSENLKAAAERFRGEGFDVARYTTVESADDVDDLRRALGAETIRLVGFSYGTHLALEVLRRHGTGVAGAVLIGVAGPEDVRKLPSDLDAQWARVAALAAADPRVGKSAADLDALLRRVMARLAEKPIAVPVPGAESRTVEVGAFGLQLLLVLDLGDTRDFVVFPRLLAEIDRGETATLAYFVGRRLAQFREFSALTWVCRGASEAGEERWARIEREAAKSPFGNAANIPFPEARAAAPFLPDLGPAFRAPVTSGVRTLFLSGSLDCNTPAAQASIVRRGVPNSVEIVIENAGHEDALDMPEAHALARRFFAGEDVSGARLARPVPRFVPLTGSDPAASHPAVDAARR